MTPTLRSDTSLFDALWRTLSIVAVLLSTWITATPALSASQLLDVDAGEEVDTLKVWVRDGGDAVPVITINEQLLDLELSAEPKETNRYKPLTLVVDTSNITTKRLGLIKKRVDTLVKKELEAGSTGVRVVYPRGSLELKQLSHYGENSLAWKTGMADMTIDANPDPSQPYYSTIGRQLSIAMMAETGSKKRKVWAVVFSSLCMGPDEAPIALGAFNGPVHLITWDEDLDASCTPGKEKWLEASKNEQVKVYKLGPDDSAIEKALKGLTAFKDVRLELKNTTDGNGIDYQGTELVFHARMPETPKADAMQRSFSEGTLPKAWSRSAKIKAKRERMTQVAVGFTVLLLLVLIGIVVQARSTAVDFAKWEAVGEAVDLATPPVDPDAWNATIFQLTGAMPIITEAAAKTAQLGPSSGFDDEGDSTRVQRKPEKDSAPAAAPAAAAAAPAAAAPAAAAAAPAASAEDATATRTAEQPQAAGTVGDEKTGMTVSMGIVEASTACDALTPFEIGVLQEGKPVARKTKMFRKSFSIGRATDNRVVIQKDDTVHRYHVVIRPAVEGKEWWLEVSPTASNRTRLNAKDLRPGGRYRVPGRFRLQLGETTEVRGRLSKK